MDGYIGGSKVGAQEVRQHLALDLKAFRGDLVKAGAGGEGNSNGEERSQVTLHL